MIVQCPDCTTRYELDPDRVPRERIRVRCPKCRYVFPVDGTMADVAPLKTGPSEAAAQPMESPAPGGSQPSAARSGRVDLSISRDRFEVPTPTPAPSPEPTPVAEPAPAAVAEPQMDPATSFEPTPSLDLEIERPSAGAPAPDRPAPTRPDPATQASPVATTTVEEEKKEQPASAVASDPADQKARRLARALVSDILVYNREVRDRALAEGNLVQALGQEIKKSWELYKEKVTPEVANQNNHFREALNDILAGGEKIF